MAVRRTRLYITRNTKVIIGKKDAVILRMFCLRSLVLNSQSIKITVIAVIISKNKLNLLKIEILCTNLLYQILYKLL